MSTLEQIFVRDCARRTNAIHAQAEREFIQMLCSFAVLVLILLGITLALIQLKFEPGHKMGILRPRPQFSSEPGLNQP